MEKGNKYYIIRVDLEGTPAWRKFIIPVEQIK